MPSLSLFRDRSLARGLAAFAGCAFAGLLFLSTGDDGRSLAGGDGDGGGSSSSAFSQQLLSGGAGGAAAALTPPGAALPKEYCVIHVHGFHHSGTGVARTFLNDAFSPDDLASDMWYDRGEAEGHNAQHVYLHDKGRGQGKGQCLRSDRDESKMWGRIWYCPKQVRDVQHEAERADQGRRLWEEWAPTWDLRKPYLIQKSPMFDVKLLDRLNVQEFAPQSINSEKNKGGTFHVVVMRHPLMSWSYFRYMYEYEHLLHNWLDAWEHVLTLFATGSVKKFAVVQYETMADPSMAPRIQEELKALVRDDCGIEPVGDRVAAAAPAPFGAHGEGSGDPVRSDRSVRRRLEYHAGFRGVSPKHLEMGTKFLNACKADGECSALMAELNPVIGGPLGYDIGDLQGFRGGHDPILFSHRNPPSLDLVRKLRQMVKKYVGVGLEDVDPRHPRYMTEHCNENC